MLEILLVAFLGRRMAAMMRGKGRSPTGYVVMLIGLWLGGEILGMILGIVLLESEDGPNLGTYVFALAGAAIGAGVAFLIARSLAPRAPVYQPGFPVAPYPSPQAMPPYAPQGAYPYAQPGAQPYAPQAAAAPAPVSMVAPPPPPPPPQVGPGPGIGV